MDDVYDRQCWTQRCIYGKVGVVDAAVDQLTVSMHDNGGHGGVDLGMGGGGQRRRRR